MTLITLRLLHHQNKEWIGIYFENLTSINSIIKKQTGARWSTTHKCWYIPLKKQAYKNLIAALEGKANCNDAELKLALQKQKVQQPEIRTTYKTTRPAGAVETLPSGLSAANKAALRSYIEQLKLKAYSPSTIKTYRNEFLQLLQILKQKEVNDLTVDDLKRYMVFAMEKQGISENTAHSRLNVLHPVGLK